jgi:hypothetical protein
MVAFLAWDQGKAVLEAEIAELQMNIRVHRSNDALFNDQHITLRYSKNICIISKTCF